MGKRSVPLISFCGINLVCATRNEFAAFAINQSRNFSNLVSFSLNGESLAKFHNDKGFAKLLSQADYVHADGMSIVFMSKFLNKPSLPEVIPTTDWFHDVAKMSEITGETHFFLGGDTNVIQDTIINVKKMYPKLNIVGYSSGYFSKQEELDILKTMNELKPHFIWVGLGRPKQELFALEIKKNCSVGVIKTCGGLFDFLAGKNKRAPLFMREMGLEWLWRLYLEPRRLFKRYLVTNYQSLKIFFVYLLKRKSVS